VVAGAVLGGGSPGAAFAQPAGWAWTPTSASGTLLGTVTANGAPASAGDWVGAFDAQGHCAGASAVIWNEGVAYVSLAIYGDDPLTAGIDEGITGAEAFTLRLGHAASGLTVPHPNAEAPLALTGWVNTNGAPMPAFSDPLVVYDFGFEVVVGMSCPPATMCPASDPWPLNPVPPGGTLSGPGTGPGGTFDPAAAGLGTHALSYVTAAGSVSCSVVVTAVPDASILTAGPFCANDGPVVLEAATAGGMFSGGGVFPAPGNPMSMVFDPSAVAPGTHPVQYSLSATGCAATGTAWLTVYPAPAAPLVTAGAQGWEATPGAVGPGNNGLSFDWLFADPEGVPTPLGVTGPLLPYAAAPSAPLFARATNGYACAALSAPIDPTPTDIGPDRAAPEAWLLGWNPDGSPRTAFPVERYCWLDLQGRQVIPSAAGAYVLVVWTLTPSGPVCHRQQVVRG
jgi:hypothetical protein